MIPSLAHAERMPLVYHADDWLSICMDGSVVPGIRFSVRNINGRKVLCVESRDQFTVHREIAGNDGKY